MTKSELQAVLGYVNIGLAMAHSIGVSVGHFGDTDFVQLAQAVNTVLLGAIQPPNAIQPQSASVASK
jgi:hypothetical protein